MLEKEQAGGDTDTDTDTTNNPYITPNHDRDTQDLKMLAIGRLRLTRCPGGRWTDGVATLHATCAHCGIDMREDSTFCGQPLNEDGYTPFDATVARRIMRDSAAKFGEET